MLPRFNNRYPPPLRQDRGQPEHLKEDSQSLNEITVGQLESGLTSGY